MKGKYVQSVFIELAMQHRNANGSVNAATVAEQCSLHPKLARYELDAVAVSNAWSQYKDIDYSIYHQQQQQQQQRVAESARPMSP